MYDLTNSNEYTTGGSNGREVDMFLNTPDTAEFATFNNPITVSFSAKVTQDSFQISTVSGASPVHDPQFEVGIYIYYNGTDSLPSYFGALQILWAPDSNANPYYLDPTSESSVSAPAGGFVASLLLPNDGKAAPINADANASLDTYTYSLNRYVVNILANTFTSANFSPDQLAAIDNLANWSMSTAYMGTSTNNQADGTSTISAQISNFVTTDNTSETYQYGQTPFASVPVADNNPQLKYNDFSSTVSGSVDGGAVGAGSSVHNEYIYNGFDSISLTVPAGGNWDFGGGYGTTTLYAGSGDNTFEGSSGATTVPASTYVNVAGGTGTVEVYDDSRVTITGAASSPIDAYEHGDSTIYAAGSATVGLHALDTVSAHFTFINTSTKAATLYIGASGSATVSGGVGGGYFVGGRLGNNSLTGGSGLVTLVGGGAGDTLFASGSGSNGNDLVSGSGDETLIATAATYGNEFGIEANADNDVVSTGGSADQDFFLNATSSGSVSTITGSSVTGASNIAFLYADSTVHGNYVFRNLITTNGNNSWDIILEHNTDSYASISGINYGAGYGKLTLSDGVSVTIMGASSTSSATSLILGYAGGLQYITHG